jgi:hypothetical protein
LGALGSEESQFNGDGRSEGTWVSEPFFFFSVLALVARLVVWVVVDVLKGEIVCQLNSQMYRDSDMAAGELEMVGCCGSQGRWKK